jgi:hypothetical protein
MDTIKTSRLIAAGLLLLAIAPLPYGYYQFLRIAITLIAGINAFHVYHQKGQWPFLIFLGIAILFNPLLPIYLDKDSWTPIDLITAIFFGFMALAQHRDENEAAG